jgi:hypothetical protein
VKTDQSYRSPDQAVESSQPLTPTNRSDPTTKQWQRQNHAAAASTDLVTCTSARSWMVSTSTGESPAGPRSRQPYEGQPQTDERVSHPTRTRPDHAHLTTDHEGRLIEA